MRDIKLHRILLFFGLLLSIISFGQSIDQAPYLVQNTLNKETGGDQSFESAAYFWEQENAAVTSSCSLTAVNCNPGFIGHQAFFQLGIKRVVFGTIDNTTSVPGLGDPTLHDFTCTQQTTITASVPQSIDITNFTHNQEDVKVYIDYNNDGDFTDAGELAFSSDKKTSHTGSITAPVTATFNTVLRMRVLSDFFDNGIASPCENIDFGQVEEYGVTILPPPALISSVSLASDNSYVDVTFNGGVYNTNGASGALETSDFNLSLSGGVATNPTVTSVTTTGGTALSGGETIIRVNFSTTGIPNGDETLEVDLGSNAVFNATGAAADADQTSNNTATLNDKAAPAITNISIPNTAMNIGDDVTVTITVASDADDYTTGSGGISGGISDLDFSGLTKVNNTTYTTTVSVTNGKADVAAGDNITVFLTLTDSSGNTSSNYTTPISQNADAIDANAPVITNVSIPNTPMKVGDVVTATITVTGDTDNYTTGSGGVSGTIGGFTVGSLSKVNNATYYATFTVTEGGTDVDALSDIPVNITITDPAGNASTAYTTAINQNSDEIDANTPAAPTVLDLHADSDSGSSDTDNNTKDTTPTLQGTGVEANATIKITSSLDGLLGSTTANGSGAWTFTPTTALTDNTTHNITITQTDTAGNESVASSALVLVIDNSAPNMIDTFNLTDATDTGVSNSDDITNHLQPIIEGTADANMTITLDFDNGGTSLGTTTSDGSGNWSLTSGSGILYTGSGYAGTQHNIQAVATDLAGNVSYKKATGILVTVDRVNPELDTSNSTPNDNATNVATTDNIILDFEENITAGTGNITIYDVTGGANFEVFDITTATATTTPGAGAVGIVDDKLYINPTNDLKEVNSYSIRIDATAIDDIAGNSLSAITNDTAFNFTTADETDPAVLEVGVVEGSGTYKIGDVL